MTQIGNRDEFERAFAAATVHDMFNWSTVILLFTIECLMGTHFLERMTDLIANGLVGKDIKGAKKIKILGHLTDPLTDSIIDIDKGVLKKWASKEACVDCRFIVARTSCNRCEKICQSKIQKSCRSVFVRLFQYCTWSRMHNLRPVQFSLYVNAYTYGWNRTG